MTSSDYLSFDPVAADYDWSRYLSPEAQAQAARLLQEESGLAPGQPLLDAGVGTGRFALPLAQLGVPVVGLDISRNMLAQLQAKYAAHSSDSALPLRLARADLRRMPVTSHVFGAVLIVHILHLISDWQQVLQEVRRVLQPGGVLLLAQEVGARGYPTREHYFELARAQGIVRQNLGSRNREEIHDYLQANGAEVARVDAGRLHWHQQFPVRRTLEALRKRTWSSFWTIPESDNEALVADTETWALQKYGSLDALEEADDELHIWTVRWPA